MEQKKKRWYLSKTLWTNFIMGVVVIAVPKVKEVMTEETLAGLFMVANFILRSVTDSKLQIR